MIKVTRTALPCSVVSIVNYATGLILASIFFVLKTFLIASMVVESKESQSESQILRSEVHRKIKRPAS